MFSCACKTLGSLSFRQHDWTHTCEDRVMTSSDLSFSSLVRFEVGFQNVWYGAEQKKKPRNFVEYSSPLVNGGFAFTSIHAFFANTHAMK